MDDQEQQLASKLAGTYLSSADQREEEHRKPLEEKEFMNQRARHNGVSHSNEDDSGTDYKKAQEDQELAFENEMSGSSSNEFHESPLSERPGGPGSLLNMRALVTTKEAGAIIGKNGQNVAHLREATGVKAGVSKVVQGVPDRVLSVQGTLDGVSQAYGYIAQTLLELPVNPRAGVKGPLITIRLLISHNLMGTIIGRQGAKIKHIQDVSGARMVASKEMLPQSTERVVEVQAGTPDAVRVAVLEIGRCLLEDWERGAGTILYNPAVRLSISGQGSLGATGGMGGAVGGMSGAAAGGLSGWPRDPFNTPPPPSALSAHHHLDTAGYDAGSYRGRWSISGPAVADPIAPHPSSPFYDPTQALTAQAQPQQQQPPMMHPKQPSHTYPPPSALRTQNVFVPLDMVGCIIGKGGSKISEIRRLSGSRISIAPVQQENGAGDRLFTIQGTAESNEKALFLLYNQLEMEKERRMSLSGHHSLEE
ncbi:uncharacterized protein VTP21DRAFT_6369 [Calcarisporiella thermophila]|uniref:uncharacterized protein n=1 Tax=Calcarisporiella thermophila TaxID=911321 RepID=UPI00374451A6